MTLTAAIPVVADLPLRVHARLARVVTLTPAPAIDRVYLVAGMHAGQVNRASKVSTFFAGKGINVARSLYRAGNPVVAVAPMPDRERHLIETGFPARTVNVTHSTRVNTVIVSANGGTTNVNEAATPLTAAAWDELTGTTTGELARLRADWLVIAGSVPSHDRDGSAARLAGLVSATQSAGIRVCVDSGGDTLRGLLDAGGAPDLVKPNTDELGDLVGRTLTSVGDVVEAAHRILNAGVGAVLASAGADGALFATDSCELWASAPPIDVVNTTGAGDAALAGFLHGEAARHGRRRGFGDPYESLTRAMSWGTRTVAEIAPAPATFDLLPGIRIDTPRSRQPLSV